MSADIFVSFASADQGQAERIISFLEANRFDCWVSYRDVSVGENYQEAITRALRASKVLIVVISRNANQSDEIPKELSLAARYKLVIVPLRLERVEPSDALSYELATRQWIDLFGDWRAGSQRLLSELAGVLGDDPGTAAPVGPRPPVRPAPIPERRFSDALAEATAAPPRPVTGQTFIPPRSAGPTTPVVIRHETAVARQVPGIAVPAASPAVIDASTTSVTDGAARIIAVAKVALVAVIVGALALGWMRGGEPSLIELFFWALLLLGCVRLVDSVLRLCFGLRPRGA